MGDLIVVVVEYGKKLKELKDMPENGNKRWLLQLYPLMKKIQLYTKLPQPVIITAIVLVILIIGLASTFFGYKPADSGIINFLLFSSLGPIVLYIFGGMALKKFYFEPRIAELVDDLRILLSSDHKLYNALETIKEFDRPMYLTVERHIPMLF